MEKLIKCGIDADGQATLDEIIEAFSGYKIYRIDAFSKQEMVVVVEPAGNVYVTFELVDDNDDGTPDVYQVYDTNYDNVKFKEVAFLWADTVKRVA